MGLNSVFFVCTFINTPVLGQNDSLIPPNHHKLLKSDPRSALCLNHPVFVDINFYNDFEVLFWWLLMYLPIFLKYTCLDNGFTDIGLFSVHVWLGVF